MATLTGQVEAISEKQGQYGPMISYKINGNWMLLKGAKFKPRDIKEGDVVDVECETNARGYTDILKGGIKLSSQQAATPAPAVGKSPAGSPAAPYKDPRQTIISTQAALNTAIAFVNIALTAEATPALTGKANEKLAYFRTWVLDEAARFYKLSTGEELDVSEAAGVIDAELPVRPKRPAKAKARVEPEYEDDDGDDEYPDQDE